MNAFNEFVMRAYVSAQCKIRSLLENEKGEANFIAVILILAVVIALLVVFRKNIEKIVTDIWNSIQGNIGDAMPSDT